MESKKKNVKWILICAAASLLLSLFSCIMGLLWNYMLATLETIWVQWIFWTLCLFFLLNAAFFFVFYTITYNDYIKIDGKQIDCVSSFRIYTISVDDIIRISDRHDRLVMVIRKFNRPIFFYFLANNKELIDYINKIKSENSAEPSPNEEPANKEAQ